MSVKVAVRVRPFNEREIKSNCQCCIEMNNSDTTSIINPDTKKPRNFTFDYSFWSHDEYEIDENGIYVPTGARYADQNSVFQKLGNDVLDNAWQGYHCCLFAYGQTGSGKSYSMIGYGANKGIVPISAEVIFKRIRETESDTQKYEVTFSMLEIYNEKVQDLLIPPSARPLGGLKIRESKMAGIFVEGLSKHPVTSYEAIAAKMDEGNMNKTIGETQMNSTSSRAHTIITIQFRQIVYFKNQKAEKFSVINLVDLAGSEKVSKTGASGDRLKEGCKINQSLTVLGRVINVLAEQSVTIPGKKKEQIPYRDSALTKILRNALGGNSKTIMICSISPATMNYEESLSTLRYADNAKKIQNKAVINESLQDKMIRQLREENETLKAQLQSGGALMSGDPGKNKELIKRLKEQLIANDLAMQDMEKSWEDKLSEQMKIEIQRKLMEDKVVKNDYNIPHVVNLNEDPQLAGKIYYNFQSGNIYIGRKNTIPECKIVLGAIGIRTIHALLSHTKAEGVIEYFVSPINMKKNSISGEEEMIKIDSLPPVPNSNIFVNGEEISVLTTLRHLDRIIFGSTTFFVFKNPREVDPEDSLKEVDWEYAQLEKMEVGEKLKQQEEVERERALKMKEEEKKAKHEAEMVTAKQAYEEMQTKYQDIFTQLEDRQRERELGSELLEKAQGDKTDLEQKLKDLQETILKKEEDHKKNQEELEKESVQQKVESNEIRLKLHELLPMIKDANISSEEMERAIKFEAKLINIFRESALNLDPMEEFKNRKTEIMIQVTNEEDGNVYLWNEETFTNRLYMIKDMYEEFKNDGVVPIVDKDLDPFWDPPDAQLIGQGYYLLKGLLSFIDNPIDVQLVGDLGKCGKLSMNVIPVDENGYINVSEDLCPETPEELINTSMDFMIEITEARDLPSQFCSGVYCEYSFFLDDKKYITQSCPYKNPNPKFDYKNMHTVELVTKELLNYLQNQALCVKVYGYSDATVNRVFKQFKKPPKMQAQALQTSPGIEEKTLPIRRTKTNPTDHPVSQMTSTTTTGTTSTGTGHHKQPILTKKQLKKLKKEEAAKLKKANKDERELI